MGFHSIILKSFSRYMSRSQIDKEYYYSICKVIDRKFSIRVGSLAPIHQALIDNTNETIRVQLMNKRYYDYPWMFLQDNCTCPDCFHESSKSRKKLMTSLDLDKRITHVTVNEDRNGVNCRWSDGHLSSFSETWLQERRFTEENTTGRRYILRDKPELFGADYQIQRDNFNEVIENPQRLIHLFKILCKNGVFILQDAPKETGQLRKFIEKFGFIRTTHYGIEFTVKSEVNASNMAYTSNTLGVHTDLPYYVYPPGVQFLHFIKQYEGDTEGGMTHLVDGFHVAEQMKVDHYENYKILSTVPLEFADIGNDFRRFHKIFHSPTFVHSSNNGEQLERIVYNSQQLSSCLPIPISQVKTLYESLKLFTNLCYDTKNLMRFKLKEGEVLIFDNWRLLHGREGYDASKGNRLVEGCYVDWDEIYSTIRVIESDL